MSSRTALMVQPRNGTWLAGPGGGTVRATSPATLHRPASQTGRGGPRRSNRFEGGQWKSISSEVSIASREPHPRPSSPSSWAEAWGSNVATSPVERGRQQSLAARPTTSGGRCGVDMGPPKPRPVTSSGRSRRGGGQAAACLGSGGHGVFDDASVGSLHSTLSKLSMPTFKVHPGDQHYHQNRCQTEFFSNLAYGRPPTVQPKAASNAGIRNADHYWRVVKDAPGHDNWKLYSPSKTNARGARYSTPQSNTVREVYGRKAKAPLLFARASSPSGGRPRSPFNFTATGYAKSPPGSRPRSPYF